VGPRRFRGPRSDLLGGREDRAPVAPKDRRPAPKVPVNGGRRTYVRIVGLRWTISSGSAEQWESWIAWDDDVDVGHVSRSLWPVDVDGWRAHYWGHDQMLRGGPRLGADRTEVGGLWASADEAKAAVEERHAGTRACE
jgi:hypothetical protein